MMFNSDSKPTEPSKIAGAAPQSDPDPNLLKLKRSRPLPSGMHQAGRQAERICPVGIETLSAAGF